jgi:hypothetical protein
MAFGGIGTLASAVFANSRGYVSAIAAFRCTHFGRSPDQLGPYKLIYSEVQLAKHLHVARTRFISACVFQPGKNASEETLSSKEVNRCAHGYGGWKGDGAHHFDVRVGFRGGQHLTCIETQEPFWRKLKLDPLLSQQQNFHGLRKAHIAKQRQDQDRPVHPWQVYEPQRRGEWGIRQPHSEGHDG